MMKTWLCALLAWSSCHAHQLKKRPIDHSPDDCFVCHIVRAEIVMEDDGAENLDDDTTAPLCITQREKSYRETFDIDLPDYFLEKFSHYINSGGAELCIAGGYVAGNKVMVPSEDSIRFQHMEHGYDRRLQTDFRSGTKRVLVVRISSSFGEEPTDSLIDAEGAIFGTGENPVSVSVKKQLKAVSHGKLQIQPAQGSKISAGMAEVTIDVPVVDAPVLRQLVPSILDRTENELGNLDELADIFIFCLPDGGLLNGKKWTAFTSVFEPYSYYQKSRCSRLSVLMHELGHSQLGFKHSGRTKNGTENEMADLGCYMGYTQNKKSFPRMAYNAHKHWLTGWFSDREENITLAKAWGSNKRLVSFVDYGHQDLRTGDILLLRVGQLYIQYNRAKGYNKETGRKLADKVLVREATADLDVSDAVADLSAGDIFTYENFGGSQDSLVIEVCSIQFDLIDYAVMSIHLDNGRQSRKCPKKPAPPTKSPVSETSAPVVIVTKAPTPTPSLSPTLALPISAEPTLEQTDAPTTSLLGTPTAAPFETPSKRPTLHPTTNNRNYKSVATKPPIAPVSNKTVQDTVSDSSDQITNAPTGTHTEPTLAPSPNGFVVEDENSETFRPSTSRSRDTTLFCAMVLCLFGAL